MSIKFWTREIHWNYTPEMQKPIITGIDKRKAAAMAEKEGSDRAQRNVLLTHR